VEFLQSQLAEVAAVADELQGRAEAAEAQLHKEVTSRIGVEVRQSAKSELSVRRFLFLALSSRELNV